MILYCLLFVHLIYNQYITSVQSLSPVRLFATPWPAARQASLSITSSQSPPKAMSTESVTASNHLILYQYIVKHFISSHKAVWDSLLRTGPPWLWGFTRDLHGIKQWTVLITGLWGESFVESCFWCVIHSFIYLWREESCCPGLWCIHQHGSTVGMSVPTLWSSSFYPMPALPSPLHPLISSSWVTQVIPTGCLFYGSLYVLPCYFTESDISSLRLCLHRCPEDTFINTIFLDSTFVCWEPIFVFLFLTSFTLYNGL